MWALFSILTADMGPSSGLLFLLSDVKENGGEWKRPIHSRATEGGNNLTLTDNRKRSLTEVNITILCYVSVFLFLTNGTNNAWIPGWRMFTLLPVGGDGEVLGDGTRS